MLSYQYWSKHKKRVIIIIITIAIGIAAMVCATFMVRSNAIKSYERWLDVLGNYDGMIYNPTDSEIELLLNKSNELSGKYGVMSQIGTVNINGNPYSTAYFNEESAQELYHVTPIKGRYPVASGEILVSKKVLQALGYVACTDIIMPIEITTWDGEVIKLELTVVGVIDTEEMKRESYQVQEFMVPEVFVYPDDVNTISPIKIFFIQNSQDDENVLEALITQNKELASLKYGQGNREIVFSQILGPRTGTYQSVWERLKTKDVDKDFNSAVIIPIFSCIISIIMFLSIYNSITTAIDERQEQISMLRCIGMSKVKAITMIVREILLFIVLGFLLGYIGGILLYILIITIQIELFDIRNFWAFFVPKYISAITLNPFIYPILFGSITSLFSIIISILHMRHIPVLFNRQNINQNYKRRKRGRIHLSSIRVLNYNVIKGGGIAFISLVLVMSTAVFGFVYYWEDANHLNNTYQHKIDEIGLDGAILHAEKDIESSRFNYAQLNRHDFGISPELLKQLKQFSTQYTVVASMRAADTRISYDEYNESYAGYIEKLLSADIRIDKHQDADHMFQQFQEYYGYSSREKVFNIPSVGLMRDELEQFEPFIVSGSFDYDAIHRGEQVVWITLSQKVAQEMGIPYNVTPYEVGTVLPMSSLVSNDYDTFDFTKGVKDGIPFLSDQEGKIYYTVGKVVRYNPEIGAIIELDDITLAERYFCKGMSGTTPYNILTDFEAFSRWGILDCKFTNVDVFSKDKIVEDNFVKVWNNVMSKSTGLNTVSVTETYDTMHQNKINSIATYLSLMSVIVIVNLISMYVIFYGWISKQIPRISMLRAIGMSKKGVLKMIGIRLIKYPLFALPFTIVPIGCFELVKQYAQMKIELITSNSSMLIEDAIPWYITFPQYNLFSNILIGTILIVGAIFTVLVFLALIPTVHWINHHSIVDDIRRDQF